MSYRDELDNAVQDFLDSGGEVTRIKYANEKMTDKSRRKAYHLSKSYDSEHSKEYLEREGKKESQLVFSKEERMKE